MLVPPQSSVGFGLYNGASHPALIPDRLQGEERVPLSASTSSPSISSAVHNPRPQASHAQLPQREAQGHAPGQRSSLCIEETCLKREELQENSTNEDRLSSLADSSGFSMKTSSCPLHPQDCHPFLLLCTLSSVTARRIPLTTVGWHFRVLESSMMQLPKGKAWSHAPGRPINQAQRRYIPEARRCARRDQETNENRCGGV